MVYNLLIEFFNKSFIYYILYKISCYILTNKLSILDVMLSHI